MITNVSYAADAVLRLLLFWSMLLPLGACWSIDRLRGAVPDPPTRRVLSIATVGLFLQIAFVYWFAVLLKSGPEWRVDGTALYYALSAKQIETPLATYLLQFPDLLKCLPSRPWQSRLSRHCCSSPHSGLSRRV